MNTRAIKYTITNKEHFLKYERADGEEQLFLGYACAIPVLGKQKVLLKFTSRKSIALTNVLHVPSMRINLILVLLYRVRIKLVFDSDKLTLTKNGELVGRDFATRVYFVFDYLQ